MQTVYDDNPVSSPGQEASPEEASEREEEIKVLQSCVSQLSKAEQEIISLKFGAEMTNRQIAKTLGLSESNVGVIVYRSVRKLRDGFKGDSK